MIRNKNITISKAIKFLGSAKYKTLILVDNKKTLVGTLTDGDLRRAVLKGATFKNKIDRYIFKKPFTLYESEIEKEKIQKIFSNRKLAILAIPIISKNKKVLRVIYPNNLTDSSFYKKLNLSVVIMAGGKGKRLAPFTSILPKPLVPLDGKTILEQIMQKFKKNKFDKFLISVNYKKDIIKAYLKELKNYKFKYINEKNFTGTAGSLKLMKRYLTKEFILTNCDIICDLNYQEFVNYHRKNHYDITIVSSKKNFKIPYGICEINKNMTLNKMIEKPNYNFFVNTGLYILNKKLINFLPKKAFVDMNDFLEILKKSNKKIGVFPIEESNWIDIGQWNEYTDAKNKIKNFVD